MVQSPQCGMSGARCSRSACQSRRIVSVALHASEWSSYRNLKEIERLGLNIAASLSLQFEFLNILFSTFLATLEVKFHCHRTDVPARPLTLLTGGTAHSSGWKSRTAGLEHHAPKTCNPYYTPWKLTFWPPDRHRPVIGIAFHTHLINIHCRR